MDPLAAIGLASGILTFIDFSAKVIKNAGEIYESPSGVSEESRNVEVVMTEVRRFAAGIQLPDEAQLLGEEKALCRLASECGLLAQQILDLVEKAQPRKKSRVLSFVAGFKFKWFESERQRLEERLNQCRAQLDLQLSYLTSSDIQTSLDALFSSATEDSARLERLSSHVDSLRRGVVVNYLSSEAQTQLQALLGISERGLDTIVQLRILEALTYEGMYARYETVDDSHLETLRWIFDPLLKTGHLESTSDLNAHGSPQRNNCDEFQDIRDILKDASNNETSWIRSGTPTSTLDDSFGDGSMEYESKASARKALVHWLASGRGVLHIAGKAGSGKSTLMKYLYEHECTKLLLEHWAGDRDLIFANFFFWKPGTEIQKSLAGLFRFLLHEVFRARPDLIQHCLPDCWATVKSTPWQFKAGTAYLSDKMIRKAFTQLISDKGLYKNHCFCFFLDGLDEYEGTHQEDAKKLVDLICAWTTLSSENVKICVSSREYNVFMNNFPADQRIRLQDLTRMDMTHYVYDMLGHMPCKNDLDRITRAIVANAEGIFQWVVLVVKRIREQIEDGASTKAIHEEINSLPKELADLFEHILSSLNESDQKAANRLFSMVLKLNEYNLDSLSLLSYSFLDEYIEDPQFTSRDGFQSRQMKEGPKIQRIQSAAKRVNGCCKGLLEVKHVDEEDAVRFTHRSVHEFLSRRSQTGQMRHSLEGFDPVDALSQLTLAQLWLKDYKDERGWRYLENTASALVFMRTESRFDEPPYSFLSLLSLGWKRHSEEPKPGRLIADWEILNPLDSTRNPVGPPGRLLMVRQPLYTTAFFGNYDYVKWELKKDRASIPDFSPLRLLFCLLQDPDPRSPLDLMELISCLYAHGLNPNTTTRLEGTRLALAERNWGTVAKISLWHHVLLQSYYHLDRPLSSNLIKLGYVVEKLLEYGADPYFRISATNKSRRVLTAVRVRGELQELSLKIEFEGDRRMLYECKEMTLPVMVERLPFENKAQILELIQKNSTLPDSATKMQTAPLESSNPCGSKR